VTTGSRRSGSVLLEDGMPEEMEANSIQNVTCVSYGTNVCPPRFPPRGEANPLVFIPVAPCVAPPAD
jgi:hypothetical protein